MAIVGALSWQGPMSLLVIMALVINTVYIYRPSTQDLRKSILVTSTMVAAYNVYYTVWGGVVNELIAISSSVIGIIRFRNNKKNSLKSARKGAFCVIGNKSLLGSSSPYQR